MVSFTRNELFKLITTPANWFAGDGEIPAFCDENAANVLKHRHKKGKLSQDSYDKLFFHFGYKKQLTYIKN